MVHCNVIVVLLLNVLSVMSDNILVLSPITAPSHTNFFKPIVSALAERGHSVTFWNGLPPDPGMVSNQTVNLRILYSPKLKEINAHHKTIGFQHRDSPFRLLLGIPNRMATYCTAIYQDPVFHQLMNSTERYDLIILEAVFNECVLPLVRKLDVPFIYMMGLAPSPWLLDAAGSSLNLDHIPHPGSNYADEMTLWQRTFNTLSGFVMSYFHRWFVMPVVDRYASEMLEIKDQEPIYDTENRYLSLVIVNTHFSINYQMPTSSAVIEAGGLHCVPPKPLPQELETFVNGSGDAGFIIVSFGSILKGAEIPDDVRRIFLSTFARLPQRVVWKWEESIIKDEMIPSNVRMLPWLPQQDLLGHPKVRLFITHGGLFSNQEAVYHGVPLIALPVFADQPINAQKAQDDGYAIRLDWNNLSETILYDAIQLILSNPRYAQRMREVSTIMRDQTEHPLDRAVYWIEYVIRHRGAPHLRTASRKLSLYQRCLIDVMLFVFLVCFVFTWAALSLSRVLYRKILKHKTLINNHKKTN